MEQLRHFYERAGFAYVDEDKTLTLTNSNHIFLLCNPQSYSQIRSLHFMGHAKHCKRPLGNSLDKHRHPRSDAYSAEQVLLNKQQIWCGGLLPTTQKTSKEHSVTKVNADNKQTIKTNKYVSLKNIINELNINTFNIGVLCGIT